MTIFRLGYNGGLLGPKDTAMRYHIGSQTKNSQPFDDLISQQFV